MYSRRSALMVVHVKLDSGRASREARRSLISLVITVAVAALVFGSFYVFGHRVPNQRCWLTIRLRRSMRMSSRYSRVELV